MKRCLLIIIGIISLSCGRENTYIPEQPPVMEEEKDKYEYPDSYTFNHPCGLVNASDIERVRGRIAAKDMTDPVYASWEQLCGNSFAQSTYSASPVETLVRGDATGTGTKENFIGAARDAAAAFQLALRYRISGDETYAKTAVRILNDWARICKKITANDNNQYLLAGFQGYQFASAAELLRDFDGWKSDEQVVFKNWLIDVWLSKNVWFIDTHGGPNNCSLHYWSNWELANLASILAIGIYTENPELITKVYKNFQEGDGSGCIGNMIPYAPVPDPDGRGAMLAQNMESGRDQGHATLVISLCAEICQMAYNIGIDFWGMENNKVLAMCEYTAKYNARPDGTYLCDTMPFTPYEYCINCGCGNQSHGASHTKVSDVGRGKVRPCWDLIYHHYSKVRKLSPEHTYYTKMFAEQLRYTDGVLTGDGGAGDARYGTSSGAYDQIGWSTLLFYTE